MELLADRSWYTPGEQIQIEVAAAATAVLDATQLVVAHWGDELLRVEVAGHRLVALGALAPGGYRVELLDATGVELAHTAVEVRAPGDRRMRYGFVAHYDPERDSVGVHRAVRRHHLTAVQFYDWGYRHASLIGPDDVYADPLGQPVSTATVRDLIAAVRSAGAVALGYAAVYAVGNGEWAEWEHVALLAADGAPYALAEFLRIVDPAAPDWLEHFCDDLVAASDLGFDGFHLDQYGYPKVARRADGVVVDVADSFVRLIGQVRAALPASTLVFNNVNNFGTDRTSESPQDALYIEPWAPSITLPALGRLALDARRGNDLPIVLAAYQSVYARADVASADRAAALTMATIFSHGATQLLLGEGDRILIDPYYVNNQQMAESTAAMMDRWYDFLVEHDELLLDPSIHDVTASTAGSYNDDVTVAGGSTEISVDARPGTVWHRNTVVGDRQVVHLINLAAQRDAAWDEPREPHLLVDGLSVSVRAVHGCRTRVRVADPDGSGRLIDVATTTAGTHVTALLPPLHAWQVILIEHLDEQRSVGS